MKREDKKKEERAYHHLLKYIPSLLPGLLLGPPIRLRRGLHLHDNLRGAQDILLQLLPLPRARNRPLGAPKDREGPKEIWKGLREPVRGGQAIRVLHLEGLGHRGA